MVRYQRARELVSPLVLFALVAVFFFATGIGSRMLPGGAFSYTHLWHVGVLEFFQQRGATRLPLWYSLPATGFPFWAGAPGGALLADPVVLLASVLRVSPSHILWLLAGFHVLTASLGVYRWLRLTEVPSGFALLGALIYAGSPLLVSLSADGTLHLATIVAALPWFVQSMAVRPRRLGITDSLLCMIVGAWTVLVAGWSGICAAIVGAWAVSAFTPSGPKSLGRIISVPRVSWREFVLFFGIGAVVGFPHLEFRFHSLEFLSSAPPHFVLPLFGLLLPQPHSQTESTVCPYFSIFIAFLPVIWFSRRLQENVRDALRFVAVFALVSVTSAIVFWLLDGESPKRALVLGAVVSFAYLGLLISRTLAEHLDQTLRSRFATNDLAYHLRWAFSLAIALILLSAATHLFAAHRSSTSRELAAPSSASLLATEHEIPSGKGTGAEKGLAVPASPAEQTRNILLQQGLLLLVLALVLFAAQHGQSIRASLSALTVLLLIDFRTAHEWCVARTPARASSALDHAENILSKLTEDAQSRVLLSPSDPKVAAALQRYGVPVVNYPLRRAPRSFARAAVKLPQIVPQKTARMSPESQWIYLASAGTRWVLATSGTEVQLPPTAPIVVSQLDRNLIRLATKPLRAQVWQRVARVHDAAQALALTLNRDWNAEEMYIEGLAMSDVLAPPTRGNLGDARLVWDVGNDLGVEVSAPLPSFVVLSDATYPGWRAWVNDKPSAILRANGWMRAVFVPAGRSMVRFVYLPASYRFGGFVTMLSLAIAVIWLSRPFTQGRRTVLQPRS